MTSEQHIAADLREQFPDGVLAEQQTADGIPTIWISPGSIQSVLRRLRPVWPMLYDLTVIDERARVHRDGQPRSDFTVVYQLLSFERNADVRLKVPLVGEYPSIPSITSIWPSAAFYEREAWDMFGVTFDGHPFLERILMPRGWSGHPLRKEHPARATGMPPFVLPDSAEVERVQPDDLKFRPEEYGLLRATDESDFMFLNFGPQHPGTHGVIQLVLQLDGERVVDLVPEIGYHHRGAEKMAERQTWHTYIPYTDRVDYLSGVVNNLAYLLSVEKLAGIEVPEHAQVARVMLCELFRISSHLVWYGTFAQDLGQLSPVFYMFTDREKLFDIVEAVTGGRMHPNWFRIGGLAQALPRGWDRMFRDFLAYMPKRLDEYDRLVMRNGIFKARSIGVGAYSLAEAIEWGVTGPGLRACGLDWDFRKARPYSGYDQFDFEIPTAEGGDCYARAQVRVEEMRQSLRIIQQCVDNMPEGPHKADHPLAVPPFKDRTLHDIETLITHFLSVSWGPVIPPGEAGIGIEATKGNNTYYLISDGSIHAYRARIRTPSFAHMQMLPLMSRGHLIADVAAILGSIDFVLSDVDR